jgi:hypothetical protein
VSSGNICQFRELFPHRLPDQSLRASERTWSTKDESIKVTSDSGV